jgi:hypothetical protein
VGEPLGISVGDSANQINEPEVAKMSVLAEPCRSAAAWRVVSFGEGKTAQLTMRT